MRYRTESDILGKINVPSDAYYGAETERAKQNFPISGLVEMPEIIKSYAIIKRSAAKANMKLGVLDTRRGGAIVSACDEIIDGKFADQFIVDVYQAGAGTSINMNLNEVIANRAIEILGGKKGNYKIVHPNDHVNMSQSTNDTFHMNIHLSSYIAINEYLIPALSKLEGALKKKSIEFKNALKIGRTHLQDAVPITFGEEFSGYVGAISAVKKRLVEAQKLLLESPMGGTAIGTGENTPKGYKEEVIRQINAYTKINFHKSSYMFKTMSTQLEEMALSDALYDTAVALDKIANDLRLMGSGPIAGFADLILPPVQPGSSIMPGKINPSMMEMMNMVCFQVMGNCSIIDRCADYGQLELNIYMVLIAHELMFSIKILSNGINAFTKRAILGLKINFKRVNANLNRDMSLATALSPYIGYAKAAHVARRAFIEDKSVKDVAIEMHILDKKLLDKILDPKNFAIKKSRRK